MDDTESDNLSFSESIGQWDNAYPTPDTSLCLSQTEVSAHGGDTPVPPCNDSPSSSSNSTSTSTSSTSDGSSTSTENTIDGSAPSSDPSNAAHAGAVRRSVVIPFEDSHTGGLRNSVMVPLEERQGGRVVRTSIIIPVEDNEDDDQEEEEEEEEEDDDDDDDEDEDDDDEYDDDGNEEKDEDDDDGGDDNGEVNGKGSKGTYIESDKELRKEFDRFKQRTSICIEGYMVMAEETKAKVNSLESRMKEIDMRDAVRRLSNVTHHHTEGIVINNKTIMELVGLVRTLDAENKRLSQQNAQIMDRLAKLEQALNISPPSPVAPGPSPVARAPSPVVKDEADDKSDLMVSRYGNVHLYSLEDIAKGLFTHQDPYHALDDRAFEALLDMTKADYAKLTFVQRSMKRMKFFNSQQEMQEKARDIISHPPSS